MLKRRFNKKSIMGIIKTYHAKQRQKQRNVSDLQLKKILENGVFEDRSEHEVVITLDGYHVYLTHDLDKIITVTSPDIERGSAEKIISSSTGKNIKQHLQHDQQKEDKELTFDDYMRNDFKQS